VLTESLALDPVDVGLGLTGFGQTHIELERFSILFVADRRCRSPAGEMTGWLLAVFG
jgi:hypothetical protein